MSESFLHAPYTLYVRWTCVRNTLDGRYMRAQCRYRAKFNDQLNLMTPIWRRGGGRQRVYWACVGAMTTRGGVIKGSVRCLSLYKYTDNDQVQVQAFFKYTVVHYKYI